MLYVHQNYPCESIQASAAEAREAVLQQELCEARKASEEQLHKQQKELESLQKTLSRACATLARQKKEAELLGKRVSTVAPNSDVNEELVTASVIFTVVVVVLCSEF